MSGRPFDDFDETVRRALGDVSTAVRPEPDLADRLIANAPAGAPKVVSLGAYRQARRWMLPLLAAATVAALAIGGAVGASILADGPDKPAVSPAPVVSQSVAPTPSASPTTEPSPSDTGSPTDAVTHTPPPTPTGFPSFRAADFSFSDPQHGWVLGEAGCPAGAVTDCAALLATSDGGQTWRRVPVPAELVSPFNLVSCGADGTPDGPCVDHVTFANDSVGYLWGLREMYWTSDGGTTWSRYQDPSPGFFAANQLFVAGDRVVRIAGPACSANCHPGRVDSAPLGTADFTQAAAPADVVGTTSTFGAHGDDLYVFADGFQDQPAGRGILRSSDGGRTWQTATSAPCGTSAILLGGGSRVAGDGSIIADCDGSSIRVAAPGSTDFSDARPLPAGPGYVMIVAADSAQVIVAVRLGGGDPSGSCYRSTDGGQTWQRGATLPDIHSVSFASGSVGFAHDEAGSFYITHDGGLTWSQQDFVR